MSRGARLSCARSIQLPCHRSESDSLPFRSLTSFPCSGAEKTLHQTLIEDQPSSAGVPFSMWTPAEEGAKRPAAPRPRNPFVPSYRPNQRALAANALRLATRCSRARGRSRDPEESDGLSRMSLEREGASNQGTALPGVRVHDARFAFAGFRKTDFVIFHSASRSDSTVRGSSYATGSPPLLRYILKK